MTRLPSPDPYLEAKLLGILLSGVFGQTRPECADPSRALAEQRPSGIHRIVLPELEDESRR
jgi:hypothetical protein